MKPKVLQQCTGVIIGFENFLTERKMTLNTSTSKEKRVDAKVKKKNINPYLVDRPNVIVQGKSNLYV